MHGFMCFVIMLVVFVASDVRAAAQNTGWGQIKSQITSHPEERAGKLTVSAYQVAGTEEITVSISQMFMKAEVGDLVHVPIQINGLAGRTALTWNLEVNFDSDILSFAGVSREDWPGGITGHLKDMGTLKMVALSQDGVSQDGVLAVVVFRAKEATTVSRASFQIEATVYDENVRRFSTVIADGWEMPIYILEMSLDSSGKVIGQYPGATDGYDELPPSYVERIGIRYDVGYPPPTPSELRDFAIILEGDRVARDIRGMNSIDMVFVVEIQFGLSDTESSDPNFIRTGINNTSATLVWDPDLLPLDATGEVRDVYFDSHLADLRDGRVTIKQLPGHSRPFDRIKFIVRRNN